MSERRDAGGGRWWGARARGVALLLVACGRAPAPQAPESAPELVETASETDDGAAVADGVPPIAPEADTSLPLAVYRAAGVPEENRRWSAADYERCLHVFGEMLRNGRADLPRAGSARSGSLFSRLVASENFAPEPPEEPARELQRYLEVFPGLLRVYAPASDGIDFSSEQASLSVALLELLKSALTESQRLTAQDGAWSEQYERQKAVTVGVVRGVGAMLAEEGRYPAPLRRHLENQLARLAPDLERHLDPESARVVQATASGGR